MYEIFTYGRFEIAPENRDAFVETWTEFASWASARPGAGTIRLFRDVRNPGRFISLGQWDSAEVVQDWKSSPEFKERLGRLVKLAEEFEPTEHVTLMSVADGSAQAHTPPEDLEAIHAPT
jgi:heme-degrading monooxygenase HmoA